MIKLLIISKLLIKIAKSCQEKLRIMLIAQQVNCKNMSLKSKLLFMHTNSSQSRLTYEYIIYLHELECA